jgi:hypothetical protein
MLHQKIISNRPNTDVEFFKLPGVHTQLLLNLESQGKIIAREVSYSDDGLKEISDTYFEKPDYYQELKNSDVVKNTTVLRREHNAKNNISVSVILSQK